MRETLSRRRIERVEQACVLVLFIDDHALLARARDLLMHAFEQRRANLQLCELAPSETSTNGITDVEVGELVVQRRTGHCPLPWSAPAGGSCAAAAGTDRMIPLSEIGARSALYRLDLARLDVELVGRIVGGRTDRRTVDATDWSVCVILRPAGDEPKMISG